MWILKPTSEGGLATRVIAEQNNVYGLGQGRTEEGDAAMPRQCARSNTFIWPRRRSDLDLQNLLWSPETNQGLLEGGWEGGTGWLGEGMCWAEHCELFRTDDSQTCTPKHNTLNVIKNKKKK